MSVCVCVCVCYSAEQISGFICENVTWPVSSGPRYSCLTVRNSSLLSWVQLGLSGSLPLHAWVLYFTKLIRSAAYQLPGGLETSLQPLPLLIRCIHLMGFSDQWGFTSSPHIMSGLWGLALSSVYVLCVCSFMCMCVWVHTLVYYMSAHYMSPLAHLIFPLLKCYAHISRGLRSFPLTRNFTSRSLK